MKIIKFKGKNEEKILEEIQNQYGNKAIVINTEKEEITGFLKSFKKPNIVITAAVKEEAIDEIPSIANEDRVNIKENKDETKEEYRLLIELKEQMSKLYSEVGELRKQPTPFKEDENTSAIHIFMKKKLVGLGIDEAICEALLSQIDETDTESFIREIYNGLESILIENKQREEARIIFFVGATGVGKTTTIAKLTAEYILQRNKKVVLFTADTYRIAAVEQLKTYSDILGVPIEIIYNAEEVPAYIEKWKDVDYIFIDTAGRSHKNEAQQKELKELIKSVDKKQIYLVMNANTTVKDTQKIIETYEALEEPFDLVITKLDETDELGNIINISYHARRPIYYTTSGQNVPSDLETFNRTSYIEGLLRGLQNE